MVRENLALIIDHSGTILRRADYYFCQPSFAWCSWPYIGGDGPLSLGQLLAGWQSGILTGRCLGCHGTALITSFSGSPLTGRNKWLGLCQECGRQQTGSSGDFSQQVTFVVALRDDTASSPGEGESYTALKATRYPDAEKKGCLPLKPVAGRVSLKTLIVELSDGINRQS